MLTLKDLQANPEIAAMVHGANEALNAIGYTDHGLRHVSYVSEHAGKLLESLGYDARTVELARMAGWVHDVGNIVNRVNHSLTGATLLFPILRDLKMDTREIGIIIGAVGEHEEQIGRPTHAVDSALIIADKSDAHRSRVRKGAARRDIHDRVNYAISDNRLWVDVENRTICYAVSMGETASVMEYLSIFSKRMNLCGDAARFLGCSYSLQINALEVFRNATASEISSGPR